MPVPSDPDAPNTRAPRLGQRWGRRVVVELLGEPGTPGRRVAMRCDCGAVDVITLPVRSPSCRACSKLDAALTKGLCVAVDAESWIRCWAKARRCERHRNGAHTISPLGLLNILERQDGLEPTRPGEEDRKHLPFPSADERP